MKKPKVSAQDIEEAMREFYEMGRSDIEPKMKSSAFVMVPLLEGYEDMAMALQVGLALLLEKPLILIGVADVWIPPRLRALADAVVELPSLSSPDAQARIHEAMDQVLAKMRPGRA